MRQWETCKQGGGDNLPDPPAFIDLPISGGPSHTSSLSLVFRIGRQLEFLRGAQKSMAIKDDLIRYLSVGKNFGLGMWLVFDAFSWVTNERGKS